MFEISPDTRALADRLAAMPHHGTVKYEELSRVIGRDVRRFRYLLYAAMRIVRNEHGANFDPVRGVGYRRMGIEETPNIGHTFRRRTRSGARLATRKMTAAVTIANDVPNDVQLKINQELSNAGLIEVAAQDRNLPPADKVKERPLPVAMAARAFLDKIGGGNGSGG